MFTWCVDSSVAMQLPALQIIASLAIVATVSAVEPDKEAKKSKGLQIGVKKRVDPDKCPIKSKKGDTLHMHYTVSITCTVCLISTISNSMVNCLCGVCQQVMVVQ